MRIRSIRPEFWSSEDVAAMDWHTRLVYIGLWSYVDDNGVGRDIERLIVADLFPLDDDLSEASVRVHGALKHLNAGGQVTRYTVDGKRFLHITAWETHQKINRPSPGRYPLPTCENAVIQGALSEPSVSPHDTLSAGEGEKGRRGEASAPADVPPEASHLCNLLADLIESNGSKRPEVTQRWLDSARLMLQRDNRDVEQAEHLIRWAQADEFWRANVLSMPKFRDKYDQLRLQSQKVTRISPRAHRTDLPEAWQ